VGIQHKYLKNRKGGDVEKEDHSEGGKKIRINRIEEVGGE
jgi:hypothetical protein